MRLWDFTNISEQAARQEAGCVLLQPASFVLFASALSAMDCRLRWKGSSGKLTTEEWDEIEEMIDQAYRDLVVPSECESVEVEMGIDQFTQEKPSGTVADTYGTAGAVQKVNFDVDHTENAGNVERVSVTGFEAAPGLYWVEIEVSQHSCGLGRIGLYEDTDNEHALIGVNHSEETRHASGLVRAIEGNSYYVWFLGAETGTIGRYITQSGIVETYARIVWTRLGD